MALDFEGVKQEGFSFPPNAKEISDLKKSGKAIVNQGKKKLEELGLESASQGIQDSLKSAFDGIDSQILSEVKKLGIDKSERKAMEQVLDDVVNKGLSEASSSLGIPDIGKLKNGMKKITRSAENMVSGSFSHPFEDSEFTLDKGTIKKPIKGISGYLDHVEKKLPEIMQAGKTKSKVDQVVQGGPTPASIDPLVPMAEEKVNVCETFNDILSSVTGGLNSVFEEISSAMNEAASAASEFLGEAVNGISDAMSKIGNKISSKLGPAINKIKDSVSSAVSELSGIAKNITNSLSDVVGKGLDALENAGQSIYDALPNIEGLDLEGEPGSGGIIEAINKMADKVGGALGEVGGALSNAASSVGSAISSASSAVSGAISDAANFVNGALNSIGDTVGKAMDSAIEFVNEEMKKLSQALSDVQDMLPSFSLPNLFKDPCVGTVMNQSGTEEMNAALNEAVEAGTGKTPTSDYQPRQVGEKQ